MFIDASYIDASLWVFLAFVTFFALVGKKGWHALHTSLDQRAKKIQQGMYEAHQRYDDAQARYEAKIQLDAQIHLQTEEMASLMDEQIQHLHRQAALNIEDFHQQEQLFLKQRLDLLKRNLAKNLKNQILERAFVLTREAIETETSTVDLRARENQRFDEALSSLERVPLLGKGESLIV